MSAHPPNPDQYTLIEQSSEVCYSNRTVKCWSISRLTIVSHKAKKKQAVHDKQVCYLHVALRPSNKANHSCKICFDLLYIYVIQ